MSHGRLVGRIGISALCAASACVVVAAPASASAQEPVAGSEHAERTTRTRFLFTPSVGWMHGTAYGVPLDMLDAQIGIGASFAPDASGVSADLTGLLAFQTGTTQYGRRLSGGDVLGLEGVLHYRWFRVGAGARLGTLAVERATRNDSLSAPKLDGYVSVGVEPFAVGGQPFFVEARLHGIQWAGVSPALWLGAGFRWCVGGCMR